MCWRDAYNPSLSYVERISPERLAVLKAEEAERVEEKSYMNMSVRKLKRTIKEYEGKGVLDIKDTNRLGWAKKALNDILYPF